MSATRRLLLWCASPEYRAWRRLNRRLSTLDDFERTFMTNALLPAWPSVRCDACGRVFEVKASPRWCPSCDGRTFTTLMDGQPATMDEA